MFQATSNIAAKVNESFLIVTAACVVLLVIVTVIMIFFLFRYNMRKNPTPTDVQEGVGLEIVLTLIPTILVIAMFYYGWVNFSYIRNPPKNAMRVDVTGRQWSWSFAYANGKQSGVLNVPLGKPVELVLASADVIHSFFIPAYRVKEDCVPGMKTHLWFIADEVGSFDIFCTEYCGLAHSHMRSKLNVMKVSDFEEWYEAKAASAKGAEAGLKLLQSKGCLGCHTTDGTKKVGPTFKGLYERMVTVITDGRERTIRADEEYIRRSVLDPNADVVKGYPPIMPTLPATGKELDEIVEYLETLK
jgi:cytochrome c oxidase subunit 2